MPKISRIKKGQLIPYFSLVNHEGKTIISDNYRQIKYLVILFFENLDINKEYLLNLDRSYAEFQKNDIEVLAVTSNGAETVKEFIKNKGLKFEILFDRDEEVINKFINKTPDGKHIYGLFITDQFNSLFNFFPSAPYGNLPEPEEILKEVNFMQIQCPECSGDDAAWPQEQE